MKTMHQTFLRSILVALVLLNACTARAATVLWNGGGGDNLWHTDANWSSGAVPGPDDDVIINVAAANPVITMTAPVVNIRSVQCAESLRMEETALALTGGTSSFRGPLNLSGSWVSVSGADAVAYASGPANLSGSSFYAYNGAKLWLTNLTTLVLTNGNMTVWAQGTDAAIYLSNVTNLVASPAYVFYIYAYEGGLVDLHRLRNPDGGLQVTSSSAGSMVDFSGLSGALAAPEGFAHSFVSTDGGAIAMPQVTALKRVTISVTGEGQMGFGSVTNAEESAFYAYHGGKLWLTNLTTLVLTNGHLRVWAQGADAAVYLPSLTNVVASPGYVFYVDAHGGGLVDLHRLRNPNGGLQVSSSSAGSMVDLSGLSGALAAPEGFAHSLSTDGGTIAMPQVTALKRVTISVTGEGQVGFGSVTNAEESAFYASNGGKLWLTNLTTLVLTNGHMTVWAQNADAAIYLSNVTNIVASPGYVLNVYAYEGGLVDLHRLRNSNGWLQVLSRSTGSVVDLSGLSGPLVAPEGFAHSFNAEGGAIPMPQVTALKRVTVSVTGEGQVGFGSVTNAEESVFYAYHGGKLWLTNLTTLVLTNGHLRVWAQGTDAAIYLSNVTNIVASPGYVFYVDAHEGGLVDLHRLRSPNGGLQVLSSSAGSMVDLSGLSGPLAAPEGFAHSFSTDGGAIAMSQITALKRVTISVTGEGQMDFGSVTNAEESAFYASNGGKLWLTNLTTLVLTNGHMIVWAQGVDAAVYLSNVTNIVASPGYVLYIYAYEGGLVDLHRLRNSNGGLQVLSRSAGSVVDLSGLSGALVAPEGFGHSFNAEGGAIPMPQVTALKRVTVSVTGEGQVGFGSVTNAEESAFYAYHGGKLWLTNLTTLVLTNGHLRVWAQGADAAVYLPSLTNVVASPGYVFYVDAHEGGLVDLHRLRNPNGGLEVLSSSAGSVVDLSGLSGALAAPEGFAHSFSAHGGAIAMLQVTALKRVTISVTGEGQMDFGSVTNAEQSVFYASNGGKLWLTNLTTLVLTNGHMTVSAQNADAAIYLSNVTNLVASPAYVFYVYAYEGGLVDLHRLRNPNGGLQVYSRSAGSVVDLSGLSGALAAPEGFAHSFNAEGGAIPMPQVTALKRVTVSVTGEGQVGFGSVTNAEESAFYAYNGGKLWLTNLTTLVLTNGHMTAWAQGVDAAVYLSNLTTVVASPGYVLYIYAYEGGVVNLNRLSSLSIGTFYVLSRGVGSVVDLSGLSSLTPQTGGSSLNTESGGVILFNDTAILIANVALHLESNPELLAPFMDAGTSLVLYGRAWRAYRIESRDPSAPNSPWSLYRRMAMTNAFQAVAPRPPLNLEFRVTEMQPEPPELDIRLAGPQQTQVILFGVPGQSYRLESKPVLDDAAAWQNGPSVTFTNAFRIFPASSSADLSRFYRARKL